MAQPSDADRSGESHQHDATPPATLRPAERGSAEGVRAPTGHGHSHLPGNTMAASTKEGLRVVAIATAGMFVVAGIEFVIFLMSQSAGLLSDALHNMGDVLTTVALWVAFLFARRPPTKRFT